MEKQETKKPILLKDVEVPSEWKDFGQVMLKCPTCGHTWNGFKNHDKYCSECGQKFEEKQTETESEVMERMKKMIYRYIFNGMVEIPNAEDPSSKTTLFLSIEIPIDYKTAVLARKCNCSLKFEADKNKEIVLEIYRGSKILETISWKDREKYNYHQTLNMNCGSVITTIPWKDKLLNINTKGNIVKKGSRAEKYGYHELTFLVNDIPEYEKSWTEIFGTNIKSHGKSLMVSKGTFLIKEVRKMIYRYEFSGMVEIPNNEEKIAMYLSVEIPVDYQTEEQAKQCPCSLRFETDENKEIVLKIYENFKQGLDDKKEYHCSVSGNVVATVHWNDRAKYKYHQSISDNDVPEYEKTWNEIFETYIKSNKNYTQTVDSLAYGITCLDEKKEIDRGQYL